MDQGLNQPTEQAAENSPGWSRAEPCVRRVREWLSRRINPAAGLVSSHWRRAFTTLTVCALVVWSGTTNRLHFVGPSATPTVANENQIDSALQSAASNALGRREGTIIVMDPRTGRVRAVVNPDIA